MCAMQRLIVWLEKRWISDIDGCCNKRQPALNLWSSLAASKAHRIMQACWLATVMACWSITCSPLRATTFSDSMTSVPSICHFTSSIAWAVHGPYSISCCHSGLVQLPSPCSATDIVAMQFRSTVCTSVESRNVVAHIEPVCPQAQSQMCSNWSSAQSEQIRCIAFSTHPFHWRIAHNVVRAVQSAALYCNCIEHMELWILRKSLKQVCTVASFNMTWQRFPFIWENYPGLSRLSRLCPFVFRTNSAAMARKSLT